MPKQRVQLSRSDIEPMKAAGALFAVMGTMTLLFLQTFPLREVMEALGPNRNFIYLLPLAAIGGAVYFYSELLGAVRTKEFEIRHANAIKIFGTVLVSMFVIIASAIIAGIFRLDYIYAYVFLIYLLLIANGWFKPFDSTKGKKP